MTFHGGGWKPKDKELQQEFVGCLDAKSGNAIGFGSLDAH